MADDLEKTQEREPRNRFEMIMEYLRSLTDNEEELEELKKKEPSIAELINFGGKYRKKSEGGLLDEGGEVDEESGNEVPIGGTKEGVRDDIPAMLSEGEFVFPEDVTRYHGLEKLMTLRQEAKMGLKKMEAMGQMGNSEEATIPDDLPFTMDDLILVVGEEKPKEKDDEPIKAQAGTFVAPTQPAGTFVPANQQLNNMGVMGFQQSMYGQQGAQNPVAVAPQVPASSVVPTVQAPPTGGYTAPTVPATPVNQPDFVPDVSSQYKPVKYINPTSGETMMINEYQGNPVSAVPAGFIRYDDYIAQGGKDPSEEEGVTTGIESTSVETAQTAGARDDESKAKASNLEKMREDRERKRVQEYNRVFNEDNIKNITDKNDPNYVSNEQLIEAYKDQMEAETIAPLIPGVGLFAAGMTRLGRGKMNKALAARFGTDFENNPEFQKLTEGVTRGSVLKQAGSDILKGFKDAFAPDFYDKYKPKYDIRSYDKTRTGTGFNLSAREQQAFDNAVDRGDDAIANHFSLIAQSRNAKDSFARQNARDIRLAQDGDQDAYDRLMSKRQVGNVRLGASSIDEIIKFGSSTTTAIKMGKAKQGKGLFGKATPTDNTPIASTSMASTKRDDTRTSNVVQQSLADKGRAAREKAEREAAAKAAAAAARRRREERNRNDRSASFAPKPKPTRAGSRGFSRKSTPKRTVSKRGGSRRGGGGGRATGGLMERET